MKAWCLVLLVLFSTQTLAQQAPTSASAQMTVSSREQMQKTLDEILVSEEYSKKTTISQWQPKHPQKESDLGWLKKLLEQLLKLGEWSKSLGVVAKILSVLFFVWLGWWIFKMRDVWLTWLGRLSLPQMTKSSAIIQAGHTLKQAPWWQELPAKEQLLGQLRALLQQGLWLPALAMLYQGTLRELDVLRQLPIDKHQTEEECLWLLQQAKQISPKEQAYFQELVALWRASAYGQKIPAEVSAGDYTAIYRLMEAWQAIYGGKYE